MLSLERRSCSSRTCCKNNIWMLFLQDNMFSEVNFDLTRSLIFTLIFSQHDFFSTLYCTWYSLCTTQYPASRKELVDLSQRNFFFFMHLPIVCFLWSILMLQTNVKRFSSLLPLFQLLPTVNLKIISSQKYNSRADGYFNTNCIYKCHVVKEINIALTFYLPNCYQPALYVNWTLNSMVAVLLLCFNVIWVKAHKYNQEFVLKIYKCKKILLHLSTSDYVLVEEKPPI